MNEDYLWDKSGQPDEQIQQLEEILGTLRYRPTPLKLARHSSTTRGRYLSLLAIAATVAVALLAGGLWLQTRTVEAPIPAVAFVPAAAPTIGQPLSVSTRPPARRKPTIVAKHNNPEAVAAKQQLMFALRLASEKLNAAYRRTQSPTQIKNQHRAG